MKDNAITILKTLIKNGYEAYLVGGCVRDELLGITPKDYDITTNATPDTVESLFENTVPTGKQYGTITVMIDDIPFEVTTYRLESEYNDNRRPSVVRFAKTLKDDLERRDFTINAMAMDIDGNIIDYFRGKEHLKNSVLRCVGNPKDRFDEDRLRILRAFRFASKYDLSISQSIYDAMYNLDVSSVSNERIRDEFNKIIVCNNPSRYIKSMAFYKILEQIIPEIKDCYGFNQHNPHHSKDVFEHILDVLDNTENKLELRLSALFHDIGKPNTFSLDENKIGHFYSHHKESAKLTREIMTRLRYSNKEIEYTSELVYNHMTRYEHLRTLNVKKFINKIGEDKIDDLFKLFIADRMASVDKNISDILKLRDMVAIVLSQKCPMSIKDLNINGNDLIEFGYVGKEIGDKLKELLELVLEDETFNDKNKLIKYCKGDKSYGN